MAKRAGQSEAEIRRVLDRLVSLRIDPEARSRVAAEALATASRFDVLYACTSALEQHPIAEAREPLLAAYDRIEASASKLDTDGSLRATVLRALRPFLVREDEPLLHSAVTTYGTTVQGAAAVELRASALVILLSIAPEVAATHAARILAEATDRDCTQRGTGEPAVTAARVLGASGETNALYLAACLEWAAPDEVVAECLRQLVDLPAAMTAHVLGLHAESDSDFVQLGLVDLAVGNESLDLGSGTARAWLKGLEPDVYRYALSAFVASRRTELHTAVAALVADEFDRGRLEIAAECLEMARGAAVLEQARGTVRSRLAE